MPANSEDFSTLREKADKRYRLLTKHFPCMIKTDRQQRSFTPFQHLLTNDRIYLPKVSDTLCPAGPCHDMTLQSICKAGDYFLLSAYCHDEEIANRHHSVIYVLDKTGSHITTWSLPFVAHVGGITFDGTYFWVCSGKNTITPFDFETCLSLTKNSYPSAYLSIESAMRNRQFVGTKTSFCDYFEGRLWVGNFSYPPDYPGEPEIYSYPVIKKAGGPVLDKSEDHVLRFPSFPQIQGIEFIEKTGEKYLLLSCSYNRFSPSRLWAIHFHNYRELHDLPFLLSGKVPFSYRLLKLPSMLEQTCRTGDRLYLLYESCARKYLRSASLCICPVTRLVSLSLQKVIEDL